MHSNTHPHDISSACPLATSSAHHMRFVIIVAGGKGLRMGGDIPKQFRIVGGKPILMHTIERFHQYDSEMGIIVVLPHSQQAYWRQLCDEYNFHVGHTVVNGGASRFESAKNGLAVIPEEICGTVGIHDGVRPFVSIEVINRCYLTAQKCGAVIPVLPVTDTLRHISADGSGKNVLRSDYRIVQTPQVFDIALLKKAFAQPEQEAFTDDASVVEAMGQTVEMVEGNRENIKITTPFDIKLAELLIPQT